MGATLSIAIVENSYNISANTSSVNVKVYVNCTGSTHSGYSKNGTVTINGTDIAYTSTMPANTSTLAYNADHTIGHHATNGTASVSVSANLVTGLTPGTITASGSKGLTSLPAGYCTLSLSLSESERVASTNTSKVTAILYASTDAYCWGTLSSCYVKVDGTTQNLSNKYVGANSTVEVGRYTKTITHAASGNTSVACSGDASSNAYRNPGSVSKSITLTEIPRGSVLGDVSAFNFESGPVINYTAYVSTYTEKVDIKIGSTVIRSGYAVNSGEQIKFTLTELLTIYRSGSSTMTFDLKTYSGASQIGTTSTKTATGTKTGNRVRKITGTYKQGLYLRKINGVWTQGIRARKIGGLWKF